MGKVHKILARSVEEFYCPRGTSNGGSPLNRGGSVTFIQRFGGALNLNVHFHMLQLEGFYQEKSTGDHIISPSVAYTFAKAAVYRLAKGDFFSLKAGGCPCLFL